MPNLIYLPNFTVNYSIIMLDRISIKKNDDALEIEIKALKDNKKQQLLLVWIALFSLCGLAIFSQFFYDYDKSSKVFFAVYLAFWFFFEFKVIYAYRWRNIGKEKIIIDSKKLLLTKEIGKRGVTQTYDLEKIKDFKVFDTPDPTFIKIINTSYWNINKYNLVFTYEDLKVPFGIDLDANQTKKILHEIKSFIKK
ncbi:MAG: hypothetical protein KFKLKKLM_01803 [Flavobacteriales bacterium]|nr:hypothetical protein [Flavobacteriales bacterium]